MDDHQPQDSGTTWAAKTIVVQGTGYVGLPAAILLADAGFSVVGVDIDENVVRAINEGVLLIDEAELKEVMERDSVRSNLRGKSEPTPADAFLVAVPTPLARRSKTADLSMLVNAVEAIAEVLAPGNLVVIESTIPPGTCRDVVTPLLERKGLTVGVDIELAHCPERILPGNVFQEIVHNDRIIGSATPRGRAWAKTIYQSFVKGDLLETDDVTAELTKLVENASRDVDIAFANELSQIAVGLGADPEEVIGLANRHPRVNVLSPGIGVGGHCIPIDPWFITEADPVNSTLIQTARHINDSRPAQMAAEIRRQVAPLSNPKILLVGATYKPDTADVRESPALDILHLLETDGYDVRMWDPLVPEWSTADDLAAAAEGFDAVFVLVKHQEVSTQLEDRDAIVEAMRGDLLIELP